MLVSLKEIFRIAEEKGCAVGSFNTPNLEALCSVIRAAQDLDQPVIIQFAQCHETLKPLALMGPMMVEAAKKASVPVCVHLDHGETLEYLEEALKMGFTGIMYDGSVLPYKENATNTKKAVDLAKQYGAGVEAELGSMGRRESGAGDQTGAEDETKIYTDPILARQFVEETGIDALACSFGTTHGIYLSEPKLDFDVIKNVRKECDDIPVVMHGGSGISEEDFQKCIQAGVRKVNYFTYMDKAGGTAVIHHEWKNPIFYSDLIKEAEEAMYQQVKEAIRVFSLQ